MCRRISLTGHICLAVLFAMTLLWAGKIKFGALYAMEASAQSGAETDLIMSRQVTLQDSVVTASATPDTVVLTATVRDFLDTHPDFQRPISGLVTGLVLDELDDEGKPVFAGEDGAGGISNLETFAQWYRDVPGINETTVISLTLAETTPGSLIYSFKDDAFFPIDNMLLGNQGRTHNYHFTLELHKEFTYQGGEVFAFSGDDDIWVFIDSRLVIDLGGVHGNISDEVELDTLGLSKGETYPLSIFFAERRTPGSHFEITTSIYTLATPLLYSISGSVTDASGQGIGGVSVHAHGPRSEYSAKTDNSGNYTINVLTPGLYNVLARRTSGPELHPHAQQVEVPPDITGINFSEQLKIASVRGKITGPDGAPIEQAVVNIGGYSATTSGPGEYHITGLPPGLHSVNVTREGYVPYAGQVQVAAQVDTTHNVELQLRKVGIYLLPYPAGATYTVIQGNQSGSNMGNWQYAYDFDMPEGASVAAAADGIVKQIRKDSATACHVNDSSCFDQGNYVRVRHKGDDGHFYDTLYYHLQPQSVAVQVNQQVIGGCEIGKAGATGYYAEHPPISRLDFTLHEADQLNSIRVGFLDVDEPGGFPIEQRAYLSENQCPNPILPGGAEPTPPQDTEPPVGTVSIHLTGTPMHALKLYAVDYHSEVVSMRLAPTKEEIQSAPWIPYAETAEWPFYTVFAQFRDTVGNESKIVSDSIEAVVYTPIQAAFAMGPSVCQGGPLSVQNRTQPYSAQYLWHWDFGSGTSTNEPEPSQTILGDFTNRPVGTYSVTLTVINKEHEDLVTEQVEILATPSASFTATRARNVVTVMAEETDALEWLWDFGDGMTASGPTATHTYTSMDAMEQAGAIMLRVVKANSCNSEAQLPLSAATSQPVRAEFTATHTSGPAPFTVTFENLSTGDYVASEWLLGDGNTSDKEDITHTYIEPGLYTVRLRVYGPGGDDARAKSNYIEVLPTPKDNEDLPTPIDNQGLFLPSLQR